MSTLPVAQKLRIRAAANDWVSRNLPTKRTLITHTSPEYSPADQAWIIDLAARQGKSDPIIVGRLLIDNDACEVKPQDPQSIAAHLSQLAWPIATDSWESDSLIGDGYEFRWDDGVESSKALADRSVDLLLTDPPYGISNPYTCESQVPRRLRKNGTDFIMPRGHFGDWDDSVEPRVWTDTVLPKVAGWAVIFCAQAQIGEYSEILKAHRFNSVGTLVWQKTNPVPFNHKYKPINAWEALVIGKRPGTPFNGHAVHNVFLFKSPSPQQRIHPTQKPLPLVEEFIRLFSNEGDFILDPFAGSATTVIAAHGLRRRVLAYEREADIFQLAYQRITQEVGIE